MYYCNIKYEIRPKSRLYFFYTPFYTARLLNLFTNAERFYIVVFVNDTRARIHLFIAFKDMKTKKRKNSDYIVDNQSKLAVIKKKKRRGNCVCRMLDTDEFAPAIKLYDERRTRLHFFILLSPMSNVGK